MTELDSFGQEVWTASFTAHLDLDLDAPAGLAWAGIHAKLGHTPQPDQHIHGGSTYKPDEANQLRLLKLAFNLRL